VVGRNKNRFEEDYMLFALALIPVIALLIFIYVKDKKEKEPIGLLIGLFFAGMATAVPAVILELIGQSVLDYILPYESPFKAFVLALIIVGPVEELGKFVVLWLITWKNKHFDYSYDAIVYAVFTSLGFAAIENVSYVFSNGVGTAFVRMFTAIPGHASFAVFMGFFLSRAKYAKYTRKSGKCASNTILALVVPIIIHGLYDAIVLAARAAGEDILMGIFALGWIGFVILLFVASCLLVNYSSKHDYCVVSIPNKPVTVYRPQIIGDWTCSTCGTKNSLNYCSSCGSRRPVDTSWTCPGCGTLSYFKFCGNCGCQRPASPVTRPQ